MEPQDPFVALRSATVVALVTTASVFFMGFLDETVYYGLLGIQASQLDFPASYFMAASFDVLMPPILLFLGFMVLEGVLASIHHRRDDQYAQPPGFFNEFPAATMAASVSILWVGHQFATLGDGERLGTWRHKLPFLDTSRLDAVIYALFIAGAVLIALTNKRKRFAGLSGASKAVQVWLTITAAFCLLVSSVVHGVDQGNDAAWADWGCASVPIATLEPFPPGLNESRQYWLVLERNGQYYLRDLETDPESRNLTVIRAAAVNQMSLSWTDSRTC